MDGYEMILNMIGTVVATLIGVATLFTILTKPMKEKIDLAGKKAEEAMTKELCQHQHGVLEKALIKGDKHFERVDEKVDGLRSDTSELSGKIDLLLIRNGVTKND